MMMLLLSAATLAAYPSRAYPRKLCAAVMLKNGLNKNAHNL